MNERYSPSPESVGVLFPNRQEKSEYHKTLTEKLENFVENQPVEFTREDEDRLIEEYEALAEQGLEGVIHVVHQGTPTGELIARSLPERWREKFYHRLHILPENGSGYKAGSVVSSAIREGDQVVIVGNDGTITSEGQAVLEQALRNRVGILSGGGPGTPKDPLYLPLLRAMEKELDAKTPGAGICLGHQLFGELITTWKHQSTEGVVPGYLEGTTAVESLTEAGKAHPVFGRLGDEITVMSFNEFHLVVPDDQTDHLPYGKVLTRNKTTNHPTSLSLDGAFSDQITTTQRHPEFGLKGVESAMLTEDHRYKLPSGREVVVSAGSHPDMLMMAKYFTASYEKLSEKFGFTEEEIQELFAPERLATHLGVNFYGPLVAHLAKLRKANI